MFTGLIEDVGKVLRISAQGTGKRLVVATKIPADEIAVGDSVAVDGCCLTIVEKSAGQFGVDIGQETLSRSAASDWTVGRKVNLERAMRMGDRLGGHLVLGHVDGVGHVEKIERAPDFVSLFIVAPENVSRYIIEKGSIALQGISLTVNSLQKDVFSVGIIPHTFSATNLSELKTGDRVNLEADMIGKYVEKFFLAAKGEKPDGLTMEFLAKHGFSS